MIIQVGYVEIEVEEEEVRRPSNFAIRLAEHEDGQVYYKQVPVYRASVKGRTEIWHRGLSRDAAIGALIRIHPEVFAAPETQPARNQNQRSKLKRTES